MKNSIPETMKALFVDKESGILNCRDVAVPVPAKGEVLIKMAFSPINPSDLARMRNAIASDETGNFIPGIEGSGVVAGTGAGILPKLRMGKRVSCSATHNYSGAWAEYLVTPATNCFPLNKKISTEQASMMIVNPMTALAFIDIAKKGKHNALINTAAASSLGKILNILGRKEGIPVINIVRDKRQADILSGIGVRHILIETQQDFTEKLRLMSHEMHATLMLDAVGGKQAGQLIEALPDKSTVIIYGNLSGEPLEIFHKSLIPGNKNVSGFFLGQWVHDNGILKSITFLNKIKKLLSGEITSNIQQKFPLDKGQEALDVYTHNMTGGKVLLEMGNYST